jgi:HAMP domain-containing protein
MAAHMLLVEQFPAAREAQMRLESAIQRRCQETQDLRQMPVHTINTVVHVVHRTDEQNITRAQINRQMQSLTRDFRARNTDKTQTPAPWSGLITDARIEFKLLDVTRTRTAVTAFSHDNGVKHPASGGVAPIDPARTLNIWVCALGGGLLGYAQFPGGPAATDGVVVNYRAFGSGGTAEAPFNRGRTLTHEVAHYLNLRHIWGDTPDCSGSDAVADTPNCAGPNFGTPTFPVVTCNNGPNGDMFMNYMDYVDDAAMCMFTTQQALRMRTALETLRAGLID